MIAELLSLVRVGPFQTAPEAPQVGWGQQEESRRAAGAGIKTPQTDKDRVRDRFKAAKRDPDEHYRKRGET